MEKSCVYKIEFKSSKLFYVGGAKLYKSRIRNHLCQLRKKKHHNKNLQSLVNEFGIDDLFFTVLEYCDPQEVSKKEQIYLDVLKPSLNITLSVTNKGLKYSKELRDKLSQSHKGIKPSAENVAKRSQTMKKLLSSLSKNKKRERINKANLSKQKKIICIETGEIFDSIAICEKKTKCDNVSAVCSGKRNNSLGLTFKYL